MRHLGGTVQFDDIAFGIVTRNCAARPTRAVLHSFCRSMGVIIPATVKEQAVIDGEIVEQVEGMIRSALEKGEDREAVYARNNRFGHIKKVASAR